MIFKFYKYSDTNIAPNKLKVATAVKSIDIYAPQVITPQGCNIITKEYIEANLAEYTHQGIRYICNCNFTGMGNNMYNYSLTVDPLSTAWYNDCFDKNNMIARSNLGTFKNDGALLRDTQPTKIIQQMNELSQDIYVVMTILNPTVNVNDGFKLSGYGSSIYVLTPKQFNEFYLKFSKKDYTTNTREGNAAAQAKVSELAACINNIYIINSSFINQGILVSGDRINLTTVSENNFLYDTTFIFDVATYGSIKRIIQSSTTINNSVQKIINLDNPININEDTITGNICIQSCLGFNATIPLNNISSSISSITSVGYRLSIAYATGDFVAEPMINGSVIFENRYTGNAAISIPFMYDSTIQTFAESTLTWVSTISQMIGGAVVIGSTMVANPILGGATAALTGVGAATSLMSNFEQYNSSGTSYKFGAGGSPTINNAISSYIIISYTPVVNKTSYQNRFGKADMESRNLMNLSGPVQTINCIAKMNNLNYSIIQSAQAQCDVGIWIL